MDERRRIEHNDHVSGAGKGQRIKAVVRTRKGMAGAAGRVLLRMSKIAPIRNTARVRV